MAQTGYTPILIYSSSTTTNAPAVGNLTNSTLGSELAINITDGKLFYKDNANVIQVIGWKTTPTTAGGTGLTSYTAGDLLYYATGTTLAKLAIGASGRWLGSSGSAPQWNAPAALTKTDDTNVTLTLGGSASTALLNAASLTLGWTGQLSVARGGTGLSTLTAGYIPYGNGTSAFSSTSNLYYGGKNMGLGTSSPVDFGSGYTTLSVNDTTGGAVAFLQAGTQKGGIFNGGNNMYIDCSNAAGNLYFRNTATGATTTLDPNGNLSCASFNTSTGTIVPASGVTTTIFTCPSLNNGCYIVTCNIPGQAPPTYSAVGLVRVGGTTLSFTSLAAATTLSISVSGQNIQAVQNSGGTNAIAWTVTRLS